MDFMFRELSPNSIILSSTILSVVSIGYITVEELLPSSQPTLELNSEVLMTKFLYLIVSLYNISTENRFIGNADQPNSQPSLCESYLSLSLELAYLFLPH